MKKTLIYGAMLLGFIAFQSCGGEAHKETVITDAEVPDAVKTAFNAKYPGATEVKWEREVENNKTEYEAKFKLDGKDMEAEYEEHGTAVKED